MSRTYKPVTIVMADDDADDVLLTAKAFAAARLGNELRCVGDGEELLDYLLHRGRYQNEYDAPTPGLVLLDLNMPRKSGTEALAEIKAHPKLKRLPVVVLTTSAAEEDVFKTYDLGANSYVRKPVRFEALVDALKTMGKYWFEIVEPATEEGVH